VTQTPPPAAANAAPYEAGLGFVTTQPWFAFAPTSQLVAFTRLLAWAVPFVHAQPAVVCRPICWRSIMFTPSNVSISPPAGHTRADDQNAGQTEHPKGTCVMSATQTLPTETELRFLPNVVIVLVLSTRMIAWPEPPSTYASFALLAVLDET
jgi:hypothetical protein